MSDDFFIPQPIFKPDEALVTLKRQLREFKLAERGNTYELRGKTVIRLEPRETRIEAQLAKRLGFTPTYANHVLQSSQDLRKFVDEVRKQVVAWSSSDD